MRILVCWTVLALATGLAANPCEPPAAVHALWPDRDAGAYLTQSDRNAKIANIRIALARTPDDLFLNRWLIELQSKPNTGNLAAEFRDKLDKHPDDPRYIYLYARALVGKDTPSAIKLLQQAISRDPKLPWTWLALTEVYSSAAFRDPAKLAENVRTYHKVCPGNLDAFEHLNVIEDQSALRELAGELRALLRKTTDPRGLRYYSTLWAAESRLAATSLVAEDLQRIEPLAQSSPPAGLVVLSEGYRLTGQPESEKRVTARLSATAPPNPAFEAFRTWEKEHPRAPGQAAWNARGAELYKASGEWIKRWPDDDFAWGQRREALMDIRSHSAEDWKQLADGLMRAPFNGDPRSLKLNIAMDWVAEGVMLPEATASLQELLQWSETQGPAESDLIQGTATSDLHAIWRPAFRWVVLVTLAQAAIQLKYFPLAHTTLDQLHQWLETDFQKYYDQDPMIFPDHQGKYLELMGWLAQAEGRKMNALAYYQQLMTNPWYAREYGGRLPQARNFFKELGGNDETWALWSKVQPLPPDRPVFPPGIAMVAWNTLDRPLLAMHIPDAAGRTWTLADFQGKTTFVFVWSVSCGPCWRELPAMQRVYDAVKDRHDVQAVSLVLDDNPALVESFMRERKFTFPALVSRAYGEAVMPEATLCQAWVIDDTGRLRLRRVNAPYPEQVWVDEALDKLNHPPRNAAP